ncbi:hypothetical protein BH20ACI2_BH20ACI2_04670 [soil metagenome]
MSGGRSVRAETLEGTTATPPGNIPLEVRKRYVITFAPQVQKTVGQRQGLKVRVVRPDLVVLARGSYIVR